METLSRQTIPNDLLDPWFVTGFVEGEGSFTYSRNGYSVALYFAIRLTATDEQILIDIKKFLGVGNIYDVKAVPPRGGNSGKTKAAKYLRSTKLSELRRVVQHFDQYPLRGTKANSYRVWREMFLEKNKGKMASQHKINLLAEELTRQSPRNQEWKA